MSRLFELFVAEWLKKNLPPEYTVKPHERIIIGKNEDIRFDIDLVIYDNATGRARCVIDTKYKTPKHPAPDDIAQVNTYADTKNCNEAILLYPIELAYPLNQSIRNKYIRSLSFKLDGDLDEEGGLFLKALFSR